MRLKGGVIIEDMSRFEVKQAMQLATTPSVGVKVEEAA